MDYNEYESRMKEIESERDAQIRDLRREYAFSNNTINVGDIIEDHYQIIKVVKIGVHTGYCRPPECYYYGELYTKKLIPRKNNKMSRVYQSDIKKLHHKG